MNKGHVAAAVVFGCSLFAGIASAQSVQFPTGNAAWTVDITYPAPKASATPPQQPDGTPAPNSAADRKAKKIEVVQFDNIKVIRITWTVGPTTEEWTVPKLPVVFKEYPNGAVFPVQKGGLETQFDTLDKPYDPSAFTWLSPGCLQEKDPITFQRKQCFHYKGVILLALPAVAGQRGSSVRSEREAWIDSKTLLPVALNTGTSICVFTFRATPPAGPLVPPQKFKDEIGYYKKIMGFP